MKYLNKFMLNENVAQANSLLKKLKISDTDPTYLKIREMLKGHEGYVYWFTKLCFEQNQLMDDLTNIWNLIKDPNGITSFFTKKIVNLESAEEFWDQYEAAKLYSIAKKVLNQFPSKQKSFFNLKVQEDFDLLVQLGKSKSLTALTRKISSFKDKESLLNAANRLLNYSFEGKFGEIVKSIESVNASIYEADEDKNIIICQVNYDQIVQLGGDTSWCIVRAESTFNSYADGGIQWIIFLVDNFGKNDRYSKIGLTTNSDYITAHDKFDGYISKNKLTEILIERGVNLEDLYFSKELLYAISDWSLIPVEVLINKDINKVDIVKRKLIFKDKNSYYRQGISKNDLSYFTEDEIERWNLVDRTEMTWQTLSEFDFNYVIKIKALNRLNYPINISSVIDNFNLTKEEIISNKVYDFSKVTTELTTLLSNYNFTKEDIINNKIYNVKNLVVSYASLSYFTKDETIKYKLIDKVRNVPINILINIGFTKEEILKKYYIALDSLSKISAEQYKRIKTKNGIIEKLNRLIFDSDYEKIDVDKEYGNDFKMLTLSLYDIDSSHLPLTSKNRKEITLGDILRGYLKINKQNIDTLLSLGYNPEDDFENFTNLFINDRINGLSTITDISSYRSFFDNEKIKELCTKKLLNAINAGQYFDYKSLLNYKSYLKTIPEWDIILTGLKKEIKRNTYRIRTTDSNHSYDEYNYKSTMNFIKLLEFNKEDILDIGIYKFVNIFEKKGVDSDFVDKIIEYLKSYDIEVDEKTEIDIIKGLLPYVNNNRLSNDEEKIYTEEYYSLLIDRDIDKEKSLNALYDNYFSQRTSLSEYEKRRYEKLFNKGGSKWLETFEKESQNILNRERDINVLKGLKGVFTNYHRDTESEIIKRRNNWYDKYFSFYKDVPSNLHNWYKNANDIYVVILLASIDKFDDFDKINNWDNINNENSRGFSFDNNMLHSFCKAICGMSSDTNMIKLSESQYKKVYKWVLSKVDTTQPWVNKYLAVCYFLYDKKRYDEFIKSVDTLKGNYGKKTTLRIDAFRYLLKYFKSKEDFDNFEKLVNKLFNFRISTKRATKMGNAEYKTSLKYLYDFESQRNDFGKKVGILFNDIKNKYDNIDVKESFILKWNDFLN